MLLPAPEKLVSSNAVATIFDVLMLVINPQEESSQERNAELLTQSLATLTLSESLQRCNAFLCPTAIEETETSSRLESEGKEQSSNKGNRLSFANLNNGGHWLGIILPHQFRTCRNK